MKKPSKSPTVLLKQKVKERILTKSAGKVGKSEGPSTTSGEEIPADSDVPPAFDPMKNALHPERWTEQDRAHWKQVGEETIQSMELQSKGELLADTTPPSIGFNHQSIVNKVDYTKPNPGAWLPVENHGSTNDLARSVISKVKSAKLDSGSDAATLARLDSSQLKSKKKD